MRRSEFSGIFMLMRTPLLLSVIIIVLVLTIPIIKSTKELIVRVNKIERYLILSKVACIDPNLALK